MVLAFVLLGALFGPPSGAHAATQTAIALSDITSPLGATFTLKRAQTATIDGENFKLTLRSMSDDSGCFSDDDCSTMNFDGTVALQKDSDKNLVQIRAGWSEDKPFQVDEFVGYIVLMHSVKRVDGELQATFSVQRVTVVRATTTPAPTTAPAIACSSFSKADAEAILGEPVQPEPYANLLIDAGHEPSVIKFLEPKGLCGYGSVAAKNDAPLDGGPRVFSAISSSHAVVAEKTTRDAELLSVMHVIQADSKDPDPTAAQILVSMLAAGDTDSVIPRLQEAAAGAAHTRAVTLTHVGKSGLWLWQTTPNGRYGALVVQVARGFIVMQAVLGPKANADIVQTVMLRVARKFESSAASPTSQPTVRLTPTKVVQRPQPCLAFDAKDAQLILGEPVQTQAVASLLFEPRNFTSDLDALPTRGLCGYGSVAFTKTAKPAADVPHIVTPISSDHAVGADRWLGKARWKLLDVISQLDAANPGQAGQDNARFKAQSDVVAEKWEGLLQQFSAMVDGSKVMRAQSVKNAFGKGLWLWRVFNSGRFAILLVHQADDSFTVVEALLPEKANEAKTLSAMKQVADRIGSVIIERPVPTATPRPVPTVFDEVPPTPQIPPTPSAICGLLSRADAEQILKEPIAESAESDNFSCTYVSTSEAQNNVLVGRLTQTYAEGLLGSAADELYISGSKSDANADRQAKVKALAKAGRIPEAFKVMNELATGLSNMHTQLVPEVGDGAIWMVTTENNKRFGVLIFVKGNRTSMIVAQPSADRLERDLLAAIIKVATKIA